MAGLILGAIRGFVSAQVSAPVARRVSTSGVTRSRRSAVALTASLTLFALAPGMIGPATALAQATADGAAPPSDAPNGQPATDAGVQQAPPAAAVDRAGRRPGATPAAPAATSDVGPKASAPSSSVGKLPANAITVRSLIIQKRLEDALRVAEGILARYPNDLEVAMQRARLLFWLGKPNAAEQAATGLYKRDRHNFGALRLIGDIRQERGDTLGAIRAYREAQLRGDPDVVLAIRLISLYLRVGESALAFEQVRPGMELPTELAFQLANARYPLRVEGWAGMTLFQGSTWRRGMVDAAYTWSPRLTLLGAVYGEERGPNARGMQLRSQLFFATDRISGDLRFAWAPQTGGFLPTVDAWAEAALRVHRRFAVGLWARYASYEVAPLYSIGPYVPIYLGRLTLKPGYLFVARGLTMAGDLAQVGHTVFFRARWQHSIRTAVFAWLYWGQEAVFNNRTVSTADESGPSLVLGWDHWLNDRLGLKVMGTVYRPIKIEATMWDLIASVRFRL